MCASAQTVNFKASSSYIKVVYRFLLLFLCQAQFKGASWRSFCGGDQDCQLPRFDLYDSQRKVRVCSVSKYSHILPFWPWSGDISRTSYLMQVFVRRTLRWRSRLSIAPVWPIRLPTECKSLLGLKIFSYFALLTLIRRYFPRFVPDASLCAPNSSLIACFPALLFWVYVFLRLTLRKHFPRFRLAARNPRKIFANVLCRIDNYDSYFLQVFLPSEE